MESLIGSIVLDKDLQRRAELERDEAGRRGWEQAHWRSTGAEREGAERGEEANGGTAEPGPRTTARRVTAQDTRGRP